MHYVDDYFPPIQNSIFSKDIQGNYTDKFIIKSISWDNQDLDKLTLTYKPYSIKCNISNGKDDNIEQVYISTVVREAENYCFEINSNNCRLIQIDCDNED